MDNRFFSLLRPLLDYLDSGRVFRTFFRWIYILMAVLNLLLPIYLLVSSLHNKIYESAGMGLLVFILAWLLLAGIGWFGFMLWWNRHYKVDEGLDSGARFLVAPMLAHFVRTFGEWLGMLVAVTGFLGSVGLTIALQLESGAALAESFNGLFAYSPYGIVAMPLLGLLILIIARLMAEAIAVLPAIANKSK